LLCSYLSGLDDHVEAAGEAVVAVHPTWNIRKSSCLRKIKAAFIQQVNFKLLNEN
jgi:hypothetical protein